MLILGNERYRDIGLLILRLGIGIMFILHGWPKFIGGPEKWAGLGAYGMGSLGINFLPTFWGFMAAVSGFFGGIHLVIGLFVRPATLLMMITMLVAAISHIVGGDGIMGASHALESAFVFASIFAMGAGKYSFDYRFSNQESI